MGRREKKVTSRAPQKEFSHLRYLVEPYDNDEDREDSLKYQSYQGAVAWKFLYPEVGVLVYEVYASDRVRSYYGWEQD